ncbi:unnamed protein product [Acanthoscelides obtectus]|uniref:Transposase n=1 Tax=Acanthoscelides obtectus TaxID=200917 RepID=A0A9P0LNA6_ACAOB|nr:unnamed protein product [Acanthoscelides obtectus]CAK1663499.1 Histone-lysine N-methyltransferase SETMAR [Acanthoscelides obtectus]
MNRLTNEQRWQIIEFYYQNSCSVKRVHRALLPIYGQFGRPTEGAIRKLETKFRTQFTLLDIKPPTRRRRVRTEENIAAVSASVSDDREMSIRRRSQQLGLCYSTTWNILRQDLGVKPYKIQLVQELKPHDLPQRFPFGEWALAKLEEDPHFYRKIVFSDEAHFWLNGYVNKQNCRIWSEDQPEALQELPTHPEKITVWCVLWAGGIIWPYFVKDDNGRNVTVNGERYQLDLADMWFQQEGATCHTAHETMALLRGEFGEQFISRLGPSIGRLDRHVRAYVYRDKPATIDALEANIEAFIREIPADMLERMVATTAGHIVTIALNEQRTVTADWYTTICLAKVITELRKINPERRIILHQDNASSHTVQKTRQYLTEENVELLDHPPYSPDLSPNDFFTFPKIKNRLRGQRFHSPEDAVDAFKNAVSDLPANEWNKCFENWFERM